MNQEIESIITHVTPVGRNIFADLGFPPDEAVKLLNETDAVITQRLAQLKKEGQKKND